MDEQTWLLANVNQTGYFRVNYDLQNWKLLIRQLHSNPQVRPRPRPSDPAGQPMRSACDSV